MDNKESAIKLSIAIPIFNEELLIPELINRVTRSVETLYLDNFEIVITDNNSTDKTLDILKDIAKEKKYRIKIVKHARNYGYQTSLQTCLQHASGDYVAVMDGDLQDPPELIPIMLEILIKEKKNIIYGVRRSRRGNFLKNRLYKFFYKLWQKVADIEIQLDSGEFAVYDRYSVNQILKFREKNRFQRGIRAYLGLKQMEYAYDRDSRYKGKSKFNFNQQLRLGLDGIYSFSFAPIRIIMVIGIYVFIFSLTLATVSTTLRIINVFDPGFSVGQMGRGLVQIFFIFTTLFGIVIIMLGIIGEYLSRIYDEIRDRPIIVEEVVNSRDFENEQ